MNRKSLFSEKENWHFRLQSVKKTRYHFVSVIWSCCSANSFFFYGHEYFTSCRKDFCAISENKTAINNKHFQKNPCDWLFTSLQKLKAQRLHWPCCIFLSIKFSIKQVSSIVAVTSFFMHLTLERTWIKVLFHFFVNWALLVEEITLMPKLSGGHLSQITILWLKFWCTCRFAW